MYTKITVAILMLSLASLACGFSYDLPDRPQAGPEVTEAITIEDPDAEEAHLTISFGAGELKLASGAENLVEGTALYNISDLKPIIEKNDSQIEIKQGDLKGLPPFDDLKNEWDLKLGAAPLDLTVRAGAYDGDLELGGLALKNLTVRDGAANVNLSFKEPNQVEMAMLRYETGASNVKLTDLANANFSTMMFSGGAGNYTLDFHGELQRDGVVTIEAGFGDLSLVIPEEVAAVVTVEGAAVNVNHSSGWAQNGQKYIQDGKGPKLTILIKMAAGNLVITD